MFRRLRTYSLFLILAIVCIACSDNEEQGNSSAYTLHLNSSSPSFGSQTRAKNGAWKNGDVIYLLFLDGGDKTVGCHATYNASTQDWTLSDIHTKLNHSDGTCRVYHLRGGSVVSDSKVANSFLLDEHTAGFADELASYMIVENDIYVTAHLLPQTWRLAFYGESGKSIVVKANSGITYFSAFSPELGLNSLTTNDYYMGIRTDGYSDFIYGRLSVSPATLTIVLDNKIYCRLIDNSLLSVGQSGYFKLPTEGNAYGWDYGGLNSTEINLEGFSTDINLDDTIGGPTEQTGSQDITIEGNSADKNLDDTTGGPTETTGAQDITIEGYGPDKILD